MDDIVIAQPVDADIADTLNSFGRVWMNPGPDPLTAPALAGRCRSAKALMAFMTERIDAEFLEGCPDLKIIAGALKGHDNLDLAACSERGVAVSIVPDLLTEPTAELALGLMIAVCRNMLPGDRYVRSGQFAGWRPKFFGNSINGATIGIVGAGKVGQALLTLLQGFRCRRLYFDKSPMSETRGRELDAEYAALDDLVAQSDFLVLGLHLTGDTIGMADAAFLKRMKPGSYLINPARGSLVVEADVADALENGHLAGYAADVFETEDWSRTDRPSAVEPALLTSESTVLTPHIGSAVTEVRREIVKSAAASIAECLSGNVPANAVNKEALGA